MCDPFFFSLRHSTVTVLLSFICAFSLAKATKAQKKSSDALNPLESLSKTDFLQMTHYGHVCSDTAMCK